MKIRPIDLERDYEPWLVEMVKRGDIPPPTDVLVVEDEDPLR